MIPGLLAQEVSKALREFISLGYETDTWPFAGKFEQLVNEQQDGQAFIKGPYVSIQLPFAKDSDSRDFFASFQTEHSPFVHQQTAWQRLKSDEQTESSIIATGTGSGKTECFLYPLLDHCLKSRDPGIKAIIIYPMNALAGDQAKRFAQIIHDTPELNNKVSVGLFVGGGEHSTEKSMTENHVISCKNTLRRSPPDILLTNYKMLDYLLMRPRDQVLWLPNKPDLLRYLVVDELHTFDGAQGADLAMLIRRLKARLSVSREQLICVGTSATLGSEAQMDDLAQYASSIFDTQFNKDSIIGESRVSSHEFLGKSSISLLDGGFNPSYFSPRASSSQDEYLERIARLFLGEETPDDILSQNGKVELANKLKIHSFLKIILEQVTSSPKTIQQLSESIKEQIPWKLVDHVNDVLIAFFSLLSHARGHQYPGEPFVTLRFQLWLRELKRIVSRVGNDSIKAPVNLQFSDDLKRQKDEAGSPIYLPVVQCKECHATAWVTAMRIGESKIEQDLREIYNRFFSNDKQTRVLLPIKNDASQPSMKGLVKRLCVHCGNLQNGTGQCTSCTQEDMVTVFEPGLNKQRKIDGANVIESRNICPVCQSNNALLLFGSKAASLGAVAVHQMFANRNNDDKKLIAFSDSVQDAAHRAGFFESRTWKNNIRMAMSQAIQAYVNVHQTDVSLHEYYLYLTDYWLNNKDNHNTMNEVEFITQFIPPNLQTDFAYQELLRDKKIKRPERLLANIKKRLEWEVMTEVGAKSAIGRTLEKTGVMSLSWDPALIIKSSEDLIALAKNKLGMDVDIESSQWILWGLALRAKRKGALFNPMLKSFIVDGGNKFLLSNNRWPYFPGIGPQSTIPGFPASQKERGLDPVFHKSRETWYVKWVAQSMANLVDDDKLQELLLLSFEVLVKSGLFNEKISEKGTKVWGLNPDELKLTTKLGCMELKSSSSDNDLEEHSGLSSYGSWYFPQEWVEHLRGMPDLNTRGNINEAAPTYQSSPLKPDSYFKTLYCSGEIHRVIGHEHTALLERNNREQLENRFMSKFEDRMPWYENLLSATPTLEMGIDIGDLSSVMLCSVPPTQASYLQRAGRGGRKDGNSFVLTLANGKPHDLFFYADPLRMLAGDVQAPAIFLNAIMVLKRQLLAYCFDCWVVTLQDSKGFPVSMRPVLDAVERRDLNKFPYTLLEYIKTHSDEIWDGFKNLLEKDVSDDVIEHLRQYLISSRAVDISLPVYVLNCLSQKVKERKRLASQQRSLENELVKIKKKPEDDATKEIISELENEIAGTKSLKYQLDKKQTLNFFTDEGLLPNYAFPEEGTTLRSVIVRRLAEKVINEDGHESQFKRETFEFMRPAQAAISELAPDSVFYANHSKVTINRIEMAKGNNLEFWRLCPSCSYSEQITGKDDHVACPRCKNKMWSDSAQKMPMVKLRQVYADTMERDAQINDDSDNREPTFYNRQMLIDFDKDQIKHAYELETKTKKFGFEFIKQATFKEINFGEQGGGDQILTVAGNEAPRPGFKICKECGSVQSKKNKNKHLYRCKYRPENLNPNNKESSDDGIIECLYLYRQYESEAIRILMPKLPLFDQEEQIQSFIATVQLGLRSQFGGSVNHLNITLHSDPIQGTDERSQYLVIYDSVPGGTGYLHTLLENPQNIMDVLKKARNIMAECPCQHEIELDGCYSCLYAYKNSYGMEMTSRFTALELLSYVLDDDIELVKVDHISTAGSDEWATSELEHRFPDAIEALNSDKEFKDTLIRITGDIVNGKRGFSLEVGENNYTIEPQVRLSEAEGAAYPCEADFLITLVKEVNDDNVIKKVAVFLDGFKYHQNSIHEDLLKRQGLSLSNQFITWSLTWHDLTNKFAGNEVKIPKVFREGTENASKKYIDAMSKREGLENHNEMISLPSLKLLLKVLENPDKEYWTKLAALRSLCWLDNKTMQDTVKIQNFQSSLLSLPIEFQDKVNEIGVEFSSFKEDKYESCNLVTQVVGHLDAIKTLDSKKMALIVEFDEGKTEKEVSRHLWFKLLQLLNLGQMLPLFFATTKSGKEAGHFSQLSWQQDRMFSTNSAWDEVFELIDEDATEFVKQLMDLSITTPIVGYELVNNKGIAIAEAELAWEEFKIAVLIDEDETAISVFNGKGWDVFTIESDVNGLTAKFER